MGQLLGSRFWFGPGYIRYPGAMVFETGENKKQIADTVQITGYFLIDFVRSAAPERDHTPLGTTDHGACQMQKGGSRPAAGEDKLT